jgi:hypothetical protein
MEFEFDPVQSAANLPSLASTSLMRSPSGAIRVRSMSADP